MNTFVNIYRLIEMEQFKQRASENRVADHVHVLLYIGPNSLKCSKRLWSLVFFPYYILGKKIAYKKLEVPISV